MRDTLVKDAQLRLLSNMKIVLQKIKRAQSLIDWVVEKVKALVALVISPQSIDQRLSPQWPLFSFLLRLGVVLYPSFFLLDFFIYPQQVLVMLAIRLGVAVYFLLAYYAASHHFQDHHGVLIASCIFIASLGISWMCYFSGEGFDSPYYVGLLQVMIVSTPLIGIASKDYIFMMLAVLVQHFVLLSATSGSFNGFYTNLFTLLVFSFVSVFLHRLIGELYRENESLRGILPICASCKKIRDDEGYWRDVAQYISQHSQAQFSHGICPGCIQKMYPDLDIGPRD